MRLRPNSTLAPTDTPLVRPTQQELIDSAFAARIQAHPELREATLLRVRDEVGDGPILTHRIYRDTNGNYFLFICAAGERGYLTYLTQERAQNALRTSPEVFRKEFGREP